jgi:hypothetical protein
MTKSIDEIMTALAEPFNPLDIDWRIQRSDKSNTWAYVLAYIDSRAVQQRLDEVVGCFNWQNKKTEFKNGVIDRIEIRNPENPTEWIGKEDGADPTDVEPFKGSMSDSMKRSAVLWGIGRYLYQMESFKIKLIDGYKNDDDGCYNIQLKDPNDPTQKKWYSWYPPELPAWALPSDNRLPEELKKGKEKCQKDLAKIFGKDPIPDDLLKRIDGAKHQMQLDVIIDDAKELVKPKDETSDKTETIEYIRECIVKAWDLLAYNFTHKNNSVKKNLDIDDYKQLSEIDDVPLLKGYREHLREEYKKKGAK